jgi:hypothetical protein
METKRRHSIVLRRQTGGIVADSRLENLQVCGA